MKCKRVLCVSYGGGHAAMLAPLIKELEKDTNVEVISLALTTAKNYLEAYGISCFGFKDFTFLAEGDWKTIGENLLDRDNMSNLVSIEESVAYMGVNMLDLIAKHGAKEAYREYERKGRQAFMPIDFMSKLLEQLSVDLVVTTNSPRSEQASVYAAKKLGIKSICLIDLFALQEYQWIKNNDYADRVCVLNQGVKDFLISKGRNEKDIVVTGNPAFDSININSHIAGGHALRAKKFSGTSMINILYASQPEPTVHPFCDLVGDPLLPRKVESWLRKIVSGNESYHLITRYHPSENIEFIPGKRVENGVGELYELIHAVDIVVTMTSTVGLEAYIAGKRVITVDLSIFTKDAPYSEMGISTGVTDYEQLKNAIDDAVKNNRRVNPNSNIDLALDNVVKEVTSLLK
ncbi:hypothetical protein [Vibrio neptunius]|uniref:hypothetical protein n=1 Tax=Vibrio neptunius TaxID=170651 RepID=UPI0019D1FED1|nr:hypothetical protein [Vibrio neptunius]MBN3575787.1 hypothetical protein [Vibrio neptunius]